MTVVPFRDSGLDARPALSFARLPVRGVPAPGARFRLVRSDPLEGVAHVALVLLHHLPGTLVASRAERAVHG